MPEKTVIIIRGLPGSGKSDLCEYLTSHTYISRDDFWTGPDVDLAIGSHSYNYHGPRSGDATAWALDRLREAVDADKETIVVDNTHTTMKEMEQWIKVAESRGYKVKIITVERSFIDCVKHGTHNVPVEAMVKMAERWESPTNRCSTTTSTCSERTKLKARSDPWTPPRP